MQEFSLMRLKNKNIKKKYTVETYANYSWVSQLVPVLEMMFGVTRHSVAFHIWCQAQLYRGGKKSTLKVLLVRQKRRTASSYLHHNAAHYQDNLLLTTEYCVVNIHFVFFKLVVQ